MVTIHALSHPIDRNCRSPVRLRCPPNRSLFRPIPVAPATLMVADHCRTTALVQTIIAMLLIHPEMLPIDRNLASNSACAACRNAGCFSIFRRHQWDQGSRTTHNLAVSSWAAHSTYG
ncbi:Hypothetical predicted protein, partial [Olea europaea subsp. europaea]